MKGIVIGLLVLLCSACAPTMLGRSARVLDEGQRSFAVTAGYPVNLTEDPVCEPGFDDQQNPERRCFFEYIGPAYMPFATPVDMTFTYGMDGQTDLVTSLAFGLVPGLRLGGKTIVFEEPDYKLSLATDYGASIFIPNGNLDLGIISSLKLDDYEPYFALKGLGTLYWSNSLPPAFSFTGTAGALFEQELGDAFFELTFGTRQYNGIGDLPSASSVGWYIMPAIGFVFN